MSILFATLLSTLAASSAAPPHLDCTVVERSISEFVAGLRNETDVQGAADRAEAFWPHLDDVLAQRAECVSDRNVSELIALVDDSTGELAMYPAGFLSMLGGRARAALPSLRRAKARAEAQDEEELRRMRATDKLAGLFGMRASDFIEMSINEIEGSRVLAPEWRDGWCARLEKSVPFTESPEFKISVLGTRVAAERCSADAFEKLRTWKIDAKKLTDAPAIPAWAWSVLDRLSEIQQGQTKAWDVCPISSRSSLRGDLKLADMTIDSVTQLGDDISYDLDLGVYDATRHSQGWVGFQVMADAPFNLGKLGEVDCGSRKVVPWP